MKRLLLPALVFASSSTFAGAQTLDTWSQSTGAGLDVCVRTEGPAGQQFWLFAGNEPGAAFDPTSAVPVTRGVFDGLGRAEINIPIASRDRLPDVYGVQLYIVQRSATGFSSTGDWLPLSGGGGTLCQEFDPNYAVGPEPLLGEFITNQWDVVGTTVSGINNTPGNPNAVIIFDSGNPTGNDDDLATPGTGTGNNTALGNLLIIPGDVVDSNGDGRVDDPCDDLGGGTIRFDFADPYRMCGATVVDIDDGAPSELRFYIGSAMTLETIPLANLGDNSVQTLTFDKTDVRRFELVLGGSGALARLEMVPCPMLVNLDETPFGKPLPLAAGENITNQFDFLGLTMSGVNNVAGHPDKVILFDSENPTGGDLDLMTPGPGINNTEPLGFILIIAENDVDANMDGLVDDPDDEEGGGRMNFVFSETITFFSTRVLDVDGMERDVFTFFDELDNTIDILEIGSLGDNSVQTLTTTTPISGIKRIQVNLTGSGALTRLRWCPDSNFAGGAPGVN